MTTTPPAGTGVPGWVTAGVSILVVIRITAWTVEGGGDVGAGVGAAVAAGATLKSDASGRGITWVTSGARVAIALQAATAAGQFIEALMIPNAA